MKMPNTKYKIQHNNRGISIIELLVYIGLLSIFIIILLDVFTSILGAKLESQSTSTINQDARYIFSKLSYDITNASSFSVPNLTTLVVGTDTYALVGDNLTLNSVRINGADTKIDALSFVQIGNTVKTSFTIESLVDEPSGNQTRVIESTFGTRP